MLLTSASLCFPKAALAFVSKCIQFGVKGFQLSYSTNCPASHIECLSYLACVSVFHKELSASLGLSLLLCHRKSFHGGVVPPVLQGTGGGFRGYRALVSIRRNPFIRWRWVPILSERFWGIQLSLSMIFSIISSVVGREWRIHFRKSIESAKR